MSQSEEWRGYEDMPANCFPFCLTLSITQITQSPAGIPKRYLPSSLQIFYGETADEVKEILRIYKNEWLSADKPESTATQDLVTFATTQLRILHEEITSRLDAVDSTLRTFPLSRLEFDLWLSGYEINLAVLGTHEDRECELDCESSTWTASLRNVIGSISV